MNDIVIFEAENQAVEVRLESESLWLTQKQMGELFATSPETALTNIGWRSRVWPSWSMRWLCWARH